MRQSIRIGHGGDQRERRNAAMEMTATGAGARMSVEYCRK